MTKDSACDKTSSDSQPWSLVTQTVHAGVHADTVYGSVMPPLYMTSTFAAADIGAQRAYDYSRCANPTRDVLADALCQLECGAGCWVAASGMGAIHMAFMLCVNPGQLIAVPQHCYGGTYRLVTTLAARGFWRVAWYDALAPDSLTRALADGARFVWVETPSNPLLYLTDIAQVVEQSRRAGALVGCDNTFMTPYWQQPLVLGCDVVAHSTTKYIGGHSDLIGGAVVVKTAEHAQQLALLGKSLGNVAGVWDAFLAMRGLRTLHLRLAAHQRNAQACAQLLAGSAQVARVYYPGLADHPQHALAKRQGKGFGAMVSLQLQGGAQAAHRFVKALRLFSLAESLGGVESLVVHPATMTHAALTDAARQQAGITPDLVRLSLGIEAQDDLLADISQALAQAGA